MTISWPTAAVLVASIAGLTILAVLDKPVAAMVVSAIGTLLSAVLPRLFAPAGSDDQVIR